MKRPFLIEEIMLDGVSGEVRGEIHLDLQSRTIERVDSQSFCFRREDNDCPVLLDPAQIALAKGVVQKVLEAEYELCQAVGRFVASAEYYSVPESTSPSTQILAEYLQTPARSAERGQKQPVREVRRAL